MKNLTIGVLVGLLLCPLFSHAGYFSLLNGRPANLGEPGSLYIQTGFVSGKRGVADYEQLGLRLGYSVTAQLELFGEIGKTELATSAKETSTGIGLLYAMPTLLEFVKASAIKASFHQADLPAFIDNQAGTGTALICDVFGNCAYIDVDVNQGTVSGGGNLTHIATQWLISGQPIDRLQVAGNPLMWYANVGLHLLRSPAGSQSRAGIGAGLVLPINAGELHMGVDYIDNAIFGFGYRHFIR